MVSLTITPKAAVRSLASDRSPEAQPRQTPPGRFICPICKRSYGDPLYHGPTGHAPLQMCFDCWAGEWACMVQMVTRGGDWRKIDSALFLLCQGFSCTEAASCCHRRAEIRATDLLGWMPARKSASLA